METHKLVVVWLADGVGCVGIALVGTGPQIELVLFDLRVRTGLVCSRIVAGHVQPGCTSKVISRLVVGEGRVLTGVFETINPSL